MMHRRSLISLGTVLLGAGIFEVLVVAAPVHALPLSLIPFGLVLLGLFLGHRPIQSSRTEGVHSGELGSGGPDKLQPVAEPPKESQGLLGLDDQGRVVCGPTQEPAIWIRETDVYQKALPALFQSVVDYLNKTTEPMSESLVTIKTSIRNFLSRVHSHDEEIVNGTALDKIIDEIRRLEVHINNVASESGEAFVVFGKEFARLKDLIARVFQLTGSISEIAERVHVLSINASIESARAGVHGRGFKVIAGEIQKLAHETQNFLKDIGGTVNVSKDIFAAIDHEIAHNQEHLENLVAMEKGTFAGVQSTISSHYGQFKDLYSGILEFIKSIESDMGTLFPLAMLHAIIIQEVENLDLVTGDYLVLLRSLFEERDGVCREFDTLATIERLRSRLTTSRELDALENVLAQLGLKGKIDLQRSNDDYEMF